MDVKAQNGTFKGYGQVIKKDAAKQKQLTDESGRFKTPGQVDAGQRDDLREHRMDG
jgi:hypothetical protein